MKRAIFAFLLVGLTILTACGGGGTTPATTTTQASNQMVGTEVQVTGGAYWVITPAQLYGFKTKDFFLLNTDESTPIMIIPGTNAYITPETLSANMNKLPVDKTAKIVVYCMSGLKSQDVAAALVADGYTRVMELKGGTVAWQQQGFQVVPYTAPATS